MDNKQFAAVVFYVVGIILEIVAACVPAASGRLIPIGIAFIGAGLAIQVSA